MSKEKNKIVVRDLPYWTTKATLESWVVKNPSTSTSSSKYTLVKLKKGKPANKQKNRPAIPAWAIFTCKDSKLTANIASAFDGVTLVPSEEMDAAIDVVHQIIPSVEYSPLQTKAIPSAKPAEDDDVCGSIFTDDRFLLFVSKLNAGFAQLAEQLTAPSAVAAESTSPTTPATTNASEKIKELIRLSDEKKETRISEGSVSADKLIRNIVKQVTSKAKLWKDFNKSPSKSIDAKKKRREIEKERKPEEKERRREERERKREEKERLLKLIEQKRERSSAHKAASANQATSSSKFTVSSSRQGCGVNKPPTAKDLRLMPSLPGDSTPPIQHQAPEPKVIVAPPQPVVVLKRKQPPISSTLEENTGKSAEQKETKRDVESKVNERKVIKREKDTLPPPPPPQAIDHKDRPNPKSAPKSAPARTAPPAPLGLDDTQPTSTDSSRGINAPIISRAETRPSQSGKNHQHAAEKHEDPQEPKAKTRNRHRKPAAVN